MLYKALQSFYTGILRVYVSSAYTYNLAGDRLSEVISTPNNAHDRNVTYTYDAADNDNSDNDPDINLNYQFNSLGWVPRSMAARARWLGAGQACLPRLYGEPGKARVAA